MQVQSSSLSRVSPLVCSGLPECRAVRLADRARKRGLHAVSYPFQETRYPRLSIRLTSFSGDQRPEAVMLEIEA